MNNRGGVESIMGPLDRERKRKRENKMIM